MTYIVISILLLVVAGAVGVANFVRRSGGKAVSRVAGYAHGVVALAAFVLLIASYSPSSPNWAYRLLALALIAGLVFFGINLATRKPPAWLGLVHGILGLAGLVLLVVVAFTGVG